MPPPIHPSVADIVQRSAGDAVAEAALELAAPVCELHMGAHVGLALAAPNWSSLAKVDNLYMNTTLGTRRCCSQSLLHFLHPTTTVALELQHASDSSRPSSQAGAQLCTSVDTVAIIPRNEWQACVSCVGQPADSHG